MLDCDVMKLDGFHMAIPFFYYEFINTWVDLHLYSMLNCRFVRLRNHPILV
jgi:hypothetical protein